MLDNEKVCYELLDRRTISSPEQMENLSGIYLKEYFSHLDQVLLLLDGELGAGKTAFCRGFAEPLAITDTINSPSFNLLNTHIGEKGTLYHYDLYRLDSLHGIEETGFPELWAGHSEIEMVFPVVHAVEWWSRAAAIMPDILPIFRIMMQYDLDAPDACRDVSLFRYPFGENESDRAVL